jgi:hypothetical protein
LKVGGEEERLLALSGKQSYIDGKYCYLINMPLIANLPPASMENRQAVNI